MTGVLLLGALVGVGMTGVLAWLVPARPSLAQAFAALHPPVTASPVTAPPVHPVVTHPDGQGWVAMLGRPLVPLLARTGLPRARARADLTVCGRDPDRHLAEQAAMALLGFLAPSAVAALLTLTGSGTGWQLPVWAGLLLAAVGAWAPDLAVASQARRRRAELRDAVAGMLDLVAVALAGGAGVEQALRDATDTTDGAGTWATQALRQAIEVAHLTRRPPWQTLGDLGETTAVTALRELSAALSLAGTEGARVRATLSARSAALSAHQLAEAETAAVSATEAMVLPVVALLARFHAARRFLTDSRHRDDGYSVEAVVVISLMVILAIAVVGVLAAKLRAKVDGIDLDGHP